MAEISRVANYFSDSLGYAPDNPWALEGLGALDLSRMRASRMPRQALAATRDAHARFRQALLQRPTSPFLWANLALTKLYLDEIDGELRSELIPVVWLTQFAVRFRYPGEPEEPGVEEARNGLEDAKRACMSIRDRLAQHP